MKILSSVLAALTLTFSGVAMADRDDWRGHRGDRHHGYQKDYRGHHDFGRHHRGHGHRHHGPRVSNHYYGGPAYYVAPPRYYGYGGYGHHGYRGGSGVTIVLPPIRFGH
ncbi:MAG: hypothetical protein ABIF28_05090 [Pseudomonadota bacterium]